MKANNLIIAKSRGRNLETHNYVRVSVNPGAGLVSSTFNSQPFLQVRKWDQIYLLTDICDLTMKKRSSIMVSPQDVDLEECVKNYKQKLTNATGFILANNLNLAKVKCIIAPVTRMNIEIYNGISSDTTKCQQLILGQSVTQTGKSLELIA